LGHSERLSSPTKEEFGLQGVTIYRKRLSAVPNDLGQSGPSQGEPPCR
jgi:hypothetical protein